MTKTINRKRQNLTLKGYYEGLPEPTRPKREFILEIVMRCKVAETTVFNWISGRTRASDPKHIAALSEITGIPAEDLWKD